MIEDLIASTRQNIIERLASPILGSFVAAWCLLNYKFLVILFSAASVSQTFQLIETVAFPDTKSIVLQGIIYPLLSSLIYVFVYPYPALLVYKFTLLQQIKTNKVKQKISDEILLSLAESRALRFEHSQREIKSQDIVDRLNAENSRLKSLIDQSQKPLVAPLEEEIELTQSGNISESQIEIMLELEKMGGTNDEDSFISMLDQSKVKTEFDLEELINMNLIAKNYNDDFHQWEYKFTHEGRRTLINLREQSSYT